MSARVLLIATEWWPNKGGVSTFNMELAAALARTGNEVHCVVRRASDEEVADAKTLGVVLHSAALAGVTDHAPFDLRVAPDVIVGHDRWTGPQAARWRSRCPAARLALLLHVHPAQIDGLKTDASIEARASRIDKGCKGIRHADAAFGVGSQLADWWASNVGGHPVHSFIPGLPTTLPSNGRVRPPHARVLVLGRAEDFELKGVDVAAKAMRQVVDTAFDAAELVVRGVTLGTEVSFESTLRELYPKPRRFSSRPFEASRAAIADDIASSTLVLQPSVEEGFGLVTLEAIRLGVPCLVGDRSGVARLIETASPAAAQEFVVKAGDISAWRDAIVRVLGDEAAAETAVLDLAAAIDRTSSWDSAAEQLVTTTRAAPERPPEASSPPLFKQLTRASANVREYPRVTNGTWIARAEQATIKQWLEAPLRDHENGVLLLIGSPGSGKSALIASVVLWAEQANLPALAIKADMVPASVGNLDALRAHLGLDDGIESTLAHLAAVFGAAILVIDQLDAVCEVVDSRTSRLGVLLQLVHRVAKLGDVRVVASVRPFELRHEARLRAILANAREVMLGSLTPENLRDVLDGANVPDDIDPSLLTPHALDLMSQLHRAEGKRFAFPPSVGPLRERFWRMAIGDDAELGREALAIAATMREQGMLWMSTRQSAETTMLVDSGLLRQSPDGKLVSFRHQTIYDFAVAQDLMDRGTLLPFIRKHEKSLEVRPFARSALLHMRASAPAEYAEAVEQLFRESESLHLRLLVIDTVLETDTPSPTEERLVRSAVADTTTRRRALNGVAQRKGWILALGTLSVASWMTDYPEHSVLLATGFLRADPEEALRILAQVWLGSSANRTRAVNVLVTAEKVGPDAVALVDRLVPHLVAEVPLGILSIGQALAKTDGASAARFCVSCAKEQRRLIIAGESGQDDGAVASGLLELETAPSIVLDELLPILLEAPRTPYQLSRWERDLADVAEQLLDRLAVQDPQGMMDRAGAVDDGHPLLQHFLAAMSGMRGHVEERVSWMVADPSRLAVDPESIRMLASMASELGPEDVGRIEDAIDNTTYYALRETEHESAVERRDRMRWNRKYRLCLRDHLPAAHRASARIVADEAERHQLPGRPFEPHRGVQGGLVRSPMSIEQLTRASDQAVLDAMKKERTPFNLDEIGPIGGPDEIVSELQKLGEPNPERLAGLVEQLRDQEATSRARRLLPKVAEHHPAPERAYALIASLVAETSATLDVDNECAWALRMLAKTAPLPEDAIVLILERLANATPISDAKVRPDEIEDDPLALAIFNGLGGYSPPDGGYSWLGALGTHFAQKGASEPDRWAQAARSVLRADPREDTWGAVLDSWRTNWIWLGGDHATGLLKEVAGAVFSVATAEPLTRVHATNRFNDPEGTEAWTKRLAASDLRTPAAELACLVLTDDRDAPWAEVLLAEWRDGEHAADFAIGVIGAVGSLLDESKRRAQAAALGVEWLPVAKADTIDLLLSKSRSELAWRPDKCSAALLEALLAAISTMTSATLRVMVGLLGEFIDSRATLVLDATELILGRAFELDSVQTYLVVEECLALSVSLRLALPDEIDRVHAVFESALAADAPAAFAALDTVDGRTHGQSIRRTFRRPRTRPRRVRRRPS
jgi:glycosyltransferase involved in cell wall biosynthesis